MNMLIACVCAVLWIFLPAPAVCADGDFVPGQVLVAFHKPAGTPDRAAALARCGATGVRTAYKDAFAVATVPVGSVLRAVRLLSQHPAVRCAEPNYIVKACGVPNDEYYSLQWHFHLLNLEEAWDISTGRGVTVAVVDSGVRSDGRDGFGDRLLSGYNAFWGVEALWEDNNFHGTHVAGTIAQATNNENGVAGIAYDAGILPVKALNSNGFGSAASVAAGIRWAVDNGADIINLSLGSSAPSWFLERAAEHAYERGVVLIAASGNEYSSQVGYPAAYESTIAVGATDLLGLRALYSNYGDALDIVAPGGDTDQDADGDSNPDGVLQETFARQLVLDFPGLGWEYVFGYYFLNGTSMACPHVAGVAALVKSLHPGWGPEEIREALTQTAQDLGPAGWDPEYGYGFLDAQAAVLY